jgi:hypothetical protein
VVRHRWHLGELLAVLLDQPDVAPRRDGAAELRAHLVGRSPGDALNPLETALVHPWLVAELARRYPALRPFRRAAEAGGLAVPPELVGEFLRRRVREFGEYLAIPPLPPEHPLRAVRVHTADEYGAALATLHEAMRRYEAAAAAPTAGPRRVTGRVTSPGTAPAPAAMLREGLTA